MIASVSAFIAHPENFFWGRIMLMILFFLAIAVPATIGWFEDRRIRRYQKSITHATKPIGLRK